MSLRPFDDRWVAVAGRDANVVAALTSPSRPRHCKHASFAGNTDDYNQPASRANR